MALTLYIKHPNRLVEWIEYPNAYIRVEGVNYQKPDAIITFRFYEEQGGKMFGEWQSKFAPSMDGGNFVAQAYAHLKTLPELVGALDC